MRYAARRAAHVGGQVRLLRVIPPADFVQWGAVQKAMEAEAVDLAETLLKNAADEIEMLTGARPHTGYRQGEAAAAQVMNVLDEDNSVRALVLAAAEKGTPGPLVTWFAGEHAGAMPCLIIIVPGGLSASQVDALA